MAEITGYVIVNGEVSDTYKYVATVSNQKEVEQHRQELRKKHNNKTGDYNICFHLRMPPSEVGRFHA